MQEQKIMHKKHDELQSLRRVRGAYEGGRENIAGH
jgi:hypothetical protein